MEIENANRRAWQAVQQAAVQKQSRQQSKDMPVIKRKSGFGWGSWTVPRPADEKKKNPVEEQNHFKRSCPEIQAG